MDYLCFKSVPTKKSNDALMTEEKDDRFYDVVNFDMDLLPVESGTTGKDIQSIVLFFSFFIVS